MTIFDTDSFSDLMDEVPAVVARASAVPRDEQAITIVTAGEAIRGQLNTIRQAEAGRGKVSLPEAYDFLWQAISDVASLRILPYTSVSHSLFLAWRAAKIRIGTNDLRIAAIAIAHNATLVTRNARDFTLVPGLLLEVWN